ncbi:MAG: primosomal protein N' [Ignavibacteriae bacterium]|nr:primosomal protein N' [Ignavibacteriota bacterium]
MKDLYANIALNLPLNRLFTYKVPERYSGEIFVGKRVLVPFSQKILTGIVISLKNESEFEKTKEIKTILDENAIFSDEMIKFSKWISDYYLAPFGEVLFSFIPNKTNIQSDTFYSLSEDFKGNLDRIKSKEEIYIDIISSFKNKKSTVLTKKQIEKKFDIKDAGKYLEYLVSENILISSKLFTRQTAEKYVKMVSRNFKPGDIESVISENKIKSEKQSAFLSKLAEVDSIELSELLKITGLSSGSVNSILKKELISIEEVRVSRDHPEVYSEEYNSVILNEEQEKVLDEIKSGLNSEEFSPYLLHGITGSGKTEVYISAIREVLKRNKTAIVLVPEISLTPQLIYRFRQNFGEKIGVIHSKLSEGERFDSFEKIKNGDYKIIIGARSALFAPVRNIGIIVVDEEHDSSYKQENSPRYNARDAAIIRAKMNNAVVLLGSATPSLESYFNAQNGKYKLLELTKRAANIKLPEIKIVDLKNRQTPEEYKKDIFNFIDKTKVRFLSKELIVEIGERLEKKESVIILQNRRGYHSYLECLNCGEVEMCPRCTISLTYHKTFNTLKCHFCGYTKKVIEVCSGCGSSKVIPVGAGTERVEEELVKIFPKAKIERLDSDSITSRKKYQQILKDFYDKKIDILVGTQMISKGLDFPDVTLVGVINADIGLLNPDFRATERTFQILTQVSGRSGRSGKKGEVLIQTSHSEFYVFEDVKNHNYMDFYEKELKSRKALNYPPFSRAAVVELKSTDRNLTESKTKEIYNLIIKLDSKKYLNLFPPTPPLFSKLKNLYRFHILIKSSKETDPSGNYIISLLKAVNEYSEKNISSKIRLTIDIDAVNLL